jgi:prolyl oligopeptidase
MRWKAFFLVVGHGLCGAVSAAPDPVAADPFEYLEQVDAPTALQWVKEHNAASVGALQSDTRFTAIASQIRQIALSQDRLSSPELHGGWIYVFFQDDTHVKGIWRRTTVDEFSKTSPQWTVLLDLDQLAAQEKEDWVWKEPLCLAPGYTRCLLNLSRGGKDAVVVREFDTERRAFVAGGFALPEAKTDIAWLDADTVLVATDFGPGSQLLDGYSSTMKLWKRGTPLSAATLVLQGQPSDVELTPTTFARPEGTRVILARGLTFYTSEYYRVDANGHTSRLDLPIDFDLRGMFDGNLIGVLRSDWTNGGKTFTRGSLVAVPWLADDGGNSSGVETIYAPDSRSALDTVTTARDSLYLSVLENVWGHLLRVTHTAKGWATSELPLPNDGSLAVQASDDFDSRLIVNYQSFLAPPRQILVQGDSNQSQVIHQMPAQFDATGLVTEQLWSVSQDGTKIPYFLVHRAGLTLDGNNPTLLYAYGGFEVSETPSYMASFGKVWLEKGGVFALANIRGGGEFGPRWHEAAILQNRQKAYDDFASVAQDLIARRITSPRRLGIRGGSNGGLLMGVAFTEHPELYRAVLCEVPLLDMLRYTQLQAGFSWVGEYGDPADAAMAAVIAKYSPYQNVKAGTAYPKVFFLTSTADDRVGPGQARKMAAKMESQGHEVLFYEATDGGHSAGATIESQVTFSALEDTYLYEQLID